ncbi:Blue-light-activated protein [Thalassocella blandensis]|nr:Blue-light-activated protein [Thalassocella blandensis]
METTLDTSSFDSFSQAALLIDTNTTILAANHSIKNLLQTDIETPSHLSGLIQDKTVIDDIASSISNKAYGLIKDCHFQLHNSARTFQLILSAYDEENFVLLLTEIIAPESIEARIQENNQYTSLLKMSEKLAKIGYWHYDIAHEKLFWSDEVYRIHGENEENFEPSLPSALAFYLDPDRQSAHRCIENAIETRQGYQYTLRIRRTDGEVRWIQSKCNVEATENGQASALLGIVQDITEEYKNKEQLERLSLVASKTTNSVIICDKIGKIEWANEGFQRLTGYSLDEVIGRKPGHFLHGPQTDKKTRENISSQLRKCQPVNCDIVNYNKDGHNYWINLVITPIIQNDVLEGYIGIQTDITDRKKSDAFVAHAQRMEAIGQLVGGISHDFNNILGILRGNLELLESKLANQENKHLDKAFHACDRATSLTKKLLQFSQFKVIESKQINPNTVINNLADLLTKSLTQNVKLELSLDDSIHSVWCNSGDLEDSILNLVLNARDAMEGNGKITITTRNVTLSETLEFSSHQLTVKPGDYIRVSIKDTGPGIPENVLARVFEPFFTTKGKQGSGLGLSMVYGFIQRTNGYILVDSSSDIGTEFCLWLPRSDYNQKPGKQKSAPSNNTIDRPYKILVVDDEPDILEIVSEYLSPLGCNVDVTSSSLEAQRRILEDKEIDLLITDEIMPGVVKGHTLVKTAIHANPKIRCIIMSGYNLDLGQIEGKADVLQKPFTRPELIALINRNISVPEKAT